MASTDSPKQPWSAGLTFFLIYLAFITTLGPLQFGYHLAELNAPEAVLRCLKHENPQSNGHILVDQAKLPQCIPMSDAQFAFVSSVYTVGGLIGALAAGPLSSHKGRLLPLRLTTVFHMLGAFVSAFAPSLPVMSIGRFLSGLGSGASLVVGPIYISEIAPHSSKGLFGASTQIMINLGILIASILGYFLSYGSMWRVILAVAGGVAVLQFLGLWFVVESPKWLAINGEVGKAKQIMARIRGKENLEDDVEDLGTAEEGQDEYDSLLGRTDSASSHSQRSQKATEGPLGILKVLVHPHHYKAIIAVAGVMLAQQLCGINSVVMYSVSFLRALLPTTAGLINVGVGVLNLVVTVICAPLSDRIGRKTCLLLSIAGMGTNAFILAFGILYNLKILSAVATLLFVASYAVGLGPVPFTLSTELVGPEAVGATQSWALGANWIATFLVAQFFPILNTILDHGRVFFVFTAIAVASFAFVAWWLPETRGKKDADEVWGRDRRRED